MGKKKIIQFVFVLILFLVVFLVQIYSDLIWGSKSKKDVKEETIRIWTIHGDTEKALYGAIDKYKEIYPHITFEVTAYKNEVYQTAINNAMLTDSLPDMFFMWGYTKLERFIEAGMIQDITGMVKKERTSAKLREGGLDAFTFDNEVYALPLYGWRASLFCNRELFAEYELEYPKTYDEFLEIIEVLKGKGVTPIATGAKEGWLSSLYYMILVQGEGRGDYVYEAALNTKLFSSAQFVEAAKKMEGIIRGGVWQKDFLEYDGYNAVHLFSRGDVGMLYYGNWASTFLESEISKVNGKVDVIPFPNGNFKEGIGGYVDTFVISKYGSVAQNEELMQMYMGLMESISNLCVNDLGAGVPVYKSQTVDKDKFPILYQCWEVGKGRIMYPAYDQIMSEELSGTYYYLLEGFVTSQKSYESFINDLAQ